MFDIDASDAAPIWQQFTSNLSSQGLNVNYQATGSGAGVAQLQAGTVDFAGSDPAMSDSEIRAGKGAVVHFPIALGAQIYYAESLEKLAANIEEVQPTIMVVVPRLFELLRSRIMKSVEGQGGLSKYLLSRALKIGERGCHRYVIEWSRCAARLMRIVQTHGRAS